MEKRERSGYPSDVTDEEWAFVAPYFRCAKKRPSNGIILCARCSTAFAMWCAPAASGATCPTICRRGMWFNSRRNVGFGRAVSRPWPRRACEQMNKPLVSVVMVTCNVDRFLAESIESILGQTFREFEFIIVDFGSTDKSKAIASNYAAKDSRFQLHEIPPCSLPEARNAGCFLAQGEYIAIADADDVSLPNRLLWEVEFMEKHPEIGLLGGAVEGINATGRPSQIFRHPLGNREIQSALLTRSVVWQPTALIRREAFAQVGGYRAAFTVAHDYDLWLRIAEHFEIANLEQVVLKYRFHPHQVSMTKRARQTLGILAAQASASARRRGKPDPLDSAEQITPTLLAGLGVTETRQQRELASDYRQWIRHMCVAGEYEIALQTALEVLHSHSELVERWQIADLYLTVARLYWRQKRFAKSSLAAIHAVVLRPVVAGRPLKPVLRRLGLL